MKIREVVEKIEGYHPYLFDYHGCDGYKSGDPEDECTGIVCALVPTYEVVQKCVELNCNLLYVHEPSYYMTPDFPEWRGDFANEVYDKKRALIDEHRIAIYRDHDHTHAHVPDGIFTGVIKYFGWDKFYLRDYKKLPFSYVFQIPPMTVAALNDFLKETVALNGVRYIGNPEDVIRKIAIVGHLYPGGFGETKEENGYFTDYSTEIIRAMECDGLQAIIPGEVIEWNVLSYIRDGAAMGKPLACFNIGHFSFEALGAKYAADWIGDLTEHALPIHYVPTGDIWRFA